MWQKILAACLVVMVAIPFAHGVEPVTFQVRSARSGDWSDARIWDGGRLPQSGDIVQIRAGHTVTYDVHSTANIRMIHVAGTLTFSRKVATMLDVGLLKIETGETTTEDGFDCHEPPAAVHAQHHHKPSPQSMPTLEIGSIAEPIPANISTTIRLRYHAGTNRDTLPAIISCGGRWEVHGAPLQRTWLKLAAPATSGERRVSLAAPVADWRIGDRVLITTGVSQGPGPGATFRKTGGRPKPVGTEDRTIVAIDGAQLTLDRPLEKTHAGEGLLRCEVANLSRNVVIESAEPGGVRGHTMYHHGSNGGIRYAEFRHLGKDGVLGKYPIHFHLVRDTMRGSGVVGASVWDSHNRWITVHGTDHLLVRDCVGYQSLGHGYFLEDATEQWNVFDRNLAVQAFNTLPLPKQVLPYDPNDGAGFWWANGRNTFTRNVACENDRYGFHFHVTQSPDFNPVLPLLAADGSLAKRDVRTVPLLRFEDNESHGEGLFDFRFGDEDDLAVQGDREHPFIARRLRAWESHYVIRPNVRCFLLDGLQAQNVAFGVYHPNFDAHVYRDLSLRNVRNEPINGGHDEGSLPRGDFVFDRLTLSDCQLKRDPLIQLTGIANRPGLSGHFRDVTITNSQSALGGVVDFGGGPRTNRTEHPVSYFFHDTPSPGKVLQVAFAKHSAVLQGGDFRSLTGWTGPDARATEVRNVSFPELLAPVDDLPPATLVTSVTSVGTKWTVVGVSHDNGDVASISVNGQPARIVSQQAGVADWTVTLDAPNDRRLKALAVDQAGNRELRPQLITVR